MAHPQRLSDWKTFRFNTSRLNSFAFEGRYDIGVCDGSNTKRENYIYLRYTHSGDTKVKVSVFFTSEQYIAVSDIDIFELKDEIPQATFVRL
jgi:hypothetical protein